ncbi:hypothetical protein Tco_0164442 [Tanacetum coccineum]
MHEDYEYVKSLEKEVDELESEKADFSNIYDLLLEECVSKDVTCSYLHSLSDLNAYAELQMLLFIFIIVKDLKAQMQDKNIAISELKKLIEKCKGKSVETQFDKPFIVRQPNAQRIPKPSVLGKPTPFSNSPEMRKLPLPQKHNREPQLPLASRNTNPHVPKSSGVNHTTSVSRPHLKCYQVKDKVVPNNSQVKFKKKDSKRPHRISSILRKQSLLTGVMTVQNLHIECE